ncbi:MAG: hypothetical protein ABI395_08905, partial [Sphingobium sp.]
MRAFGVVAHSKRFFVVAEIGTLLLLLSVAAATYFLVSAQNQSYSLLTPPIVALLLVANLVSLTGNQVTMFALPWFVLETTDSAAQTALVAATQMAAFLLAA